MTITSFGLSRRGIFISTVRFCSNEKNTLVNAPFSSAQIRPSVMAPNGVKRSLEHRYAQAVPVSGHGGNAGPSLTSRTVTFDGVERLEPVAPANHVQFVIENGDAKLKATPRHGGHLSPFVSAKIIAFDGG